MADKKKFTVQTQAVNSYGMVVLTAGIKLDRFKKNPVMLDMHCTDKLIGKWEDIQVNGNEITMSPVFNLKDDLGAKRAQEVEDGFLNGVSMGLIPLKVESGDKYNFPNDVIVVSESELREVSTAPIPSNEDALCFIDEKGVRLSAEKLQEIKLSVSNQITKPKPNTMDFKQLIVATFNLAADSTDAQIAAALQNSHNNEIKLTAENKTLKDAQDAQAAANVQNELNLAVTAGKITEEQKPTWEILLKADFKAGKAGLDAIKGTVAPVAVNLAAAVNSTQPANAAGVVNLADRTTWKLSDYMKNDMAALEKMKAEKKEDYIKLCVASGIASDQIQW